MTGSILDSKYGPLPIPSPAQASGTTAGDPLLDIVVGYLGAFLNANATQLWQAVAPGQPVVKQAFTHDPERYVFNERDLPALYLYRAGSIAPPEQLAEDWRISTDTLVLWWPFPTAIQENKRVRHAMANAISKQVDDAIERGRDPSFVLSGDTYPSQQNAQLYGTVVENAALIHRWFVRSWKVDDLKIEMSEAPTRSYEGVRIEIEMQERDVRDVDAYPPNNGLTGSVTNSDGTLDWADFNFPT